MSTSREPVWTDTVGRPSFGRELFAGRLRLDLVDAIPSFALDAESSAFLARLRRFCLDNVDGRSIEREDRIPDGVVEGLKDIGAFGIRIPKEFGGLGLPGACYHQALMIAGSAHSSLGELLATHQSVGLSQPLLLFGTDAQRKELLPRCVREISAFVLSEPDAPFHVPTTATAVTGGYLLDGVKLWAANGVRADLLVVTANGPGGISVFVVPADSPGVTVEHRSSYLGLRGSASGVISLRDVFVPVSRRIGAEGQGFEIASAAQDMGRLSVPAMCAAAAKWSLKVAREWSLARGAHEAVAGGISFIAATAFALTAMVEVSGRHADAGRFDTRLEADLARLFAAEKAWWIADELVQLRGGRGYETAESAAARGERGVPVEQLLRDVRIARIFDGSSEALRMFVAGDASTVAGRPVPSSSRAGSFGVLAQHVRFVERAARRLERDIDTGKARWGASLGTRRMFLGRIVDTAAELYAMTVSCVYAKALGDSAVELADAFCRQARRRVAALSDQLWVNTDTHDSTVATRVLTDSYTWLEEGVLDPSIPGPWLTRT